MLSELKGRLGFQPTIPGDYTADAFLAALKEYLVGHSRDSLLVVLDEADVFIERQLQDFDDRKEQCLSFRIRSGAQKEVDSQGLPRVRFVFAGYRKANTRGGAWGNWGDPLLLNPLEADEAADLIVGPLARLGIDAADAAPAIAYRCGYQPAVLLRFGERLLDLLDDRYPDVADRGHVVVTPDHVREVFDQQAVRDETRLARGGVAGEDDLGGDPVNPLALRDLETVLRKYRELGLEGYRAGLLGSHWPQSVTNPDWLANRLGYDPGQLSHPGEPRSVTSQAYLEVSPAEAESVLTDRPPKAPPALLVGGADLLRWGHRQVQVGEAVEVQGQRRLAARLGISGGVLGAGAGSSWATLGLSLLAAVIIDQIVSEVWDAVADPKGQLVAELNAKLDEVCGVVVNGEGSNPGLRAELHRLADERAAARRAYLTECLRAGPGGR